MSLTFQVPKLMSLFHCLDRSKVSRQVRGTCSCFVTKPVFTVRSCQNFIQIPCCRTTPCRLPATAYWIYSQLFHIGGRNTIRNLRTRHAAVTGTHLSRTFTSTHKTSEPLLEIFVSCLYYHQYDLYIFNSSFIWNKNGRSYTLVKLRQEIIRVPSKYIAHTLYICVHGNMLRLV
jgi:hypothetical protein